MGNMWCLSFLTLEKAYDTTWKYGIMKNLHDMDLRGRLPLFIQNFLSERKFRVRVGTSLSDFYYQEMGVPQGSILSLTLFIVKINSITSCIRNGVDKSLFVDDFGVSYRSKHMHAIAQRALYVQCTYIVRPVPAGRKAAPTSSK